MPSCPPDSSTLPSRAAGVRPFQADDPDLYNLVRTWTRGGPAVYQASSRCEKITTEGFSLFSAPRGPYGASGRQKATQDDRPIPGK
eukprot:6797006-Pyramimonas_sp.AAC.1